MPLSYLEGNPQDVYAIQRLGDTFSNALVGLASNRYRQQQFAAQQAMEQMQMQMEREKMQMQQPLIQAQIQNYGADTAQRNAMAAQARQAQMSGQDLGWLLGQYYQAQPNAEMHPDVMQAISAQIARQQGTLAATHPATIGMQVPQIMESQDPQMRRLIATGTPMVERMTPGSTLYDVAKGRSVFTAPGQAIRAPALSYDDRVRLAILNAMGRAASQPGIGTEQREAAINMIGEVGQKFRSGGAEESVPPPAQREVGKVYTTPKGKFRWTGSGWEAAQ